MNTAWKVSGKRGGGLRHFTRNMDAVVQCVKCGKTLTLKEVVETRKGVYCEQCYDNARFAGEMA